MNKESKKKLDGLVTCRMRYLINPIEKNIMINFSNPLSEYLYLKKY